MVHIRRFAIHIVMDVCKKKLACSRKYYSIIVCEIYQYIKRNHIRHSDACLEDSLQPSQFMVSRQIAIHHHQLPVYGIHGDRCPFCNKQFIYIIFSGCFENKKLLICYIYNSTCRYRAWFRRRYSWISMQ